MVSLLSDQIDRLTQTTRAISNITTHITTPAAGPFTRAVLTTHLGDLIRDVDYSEIGLFSLQSSPIPSGPQITRAQFTGATPLRKPQSRHIKVTKYKDIEPEVYAQAALKCIDRYRAIRPMPRANSQALSILELLGVVRGTIENLSNILQQTQPSEGPSVQNYIAEEERRIQELQIRIHHLHQSKKHAIALKYGSPHAGVGTTLAERRPQSPVAFQRDVACEDAPVSRFNELRFSDNLLDEQIDLGDISTSSLMSSSTSTIKLHLSPAIANDHLAHPSPTSPNILKSEDAANQSYQKHLHDITEAKRASRQPLSTLEHVESEESSLVELPLDITKTATISQVQIQLNSEVAHITTKIWVTIGDMIFPGHKFNALGDQHFGPQDTVAHLQSLSSLSLPPTSSNISSTLAAAFPTSQQILTAHLLISLLACPPHFSLPLGKVKDILARKAKASTGADPLAQGTARILYGCVAKRLLKIERGAGEQIVEFDVSIS